jgi:HK97 family phage major capsid protein
MNRKIVKIDGQNHLFVLNEETGNWEDKGVTTELTPEEQAEQFRKQVKEGVEAGVKEFKEETNKKISELEAKVKKFENMPVVSVASKVALGDEKYKGYNLKYQGMKIREMIKGRENLFPVLSDETKFRELCKFVINASQSLANKNYNNPELKTNTEGTNSQGGYLVPEEFQWDLIKLAREKSLLMSKVRTIQMSSAELSLPKEGNLVSVSIVGETSSITASTPTFGQVKLKAVKLAGLTEAISNELMADTAVDISSILIEQFMYAFALKIEDLILNGDGAGTPVFIGLLPTVSTNVVTMGSGKTSFTDANADYLSSMIDPLADADAENANWIFNRKLMTTFRTLKTTQGAYIWAQPAGKVPATIWDYPIIKSVKMPSTDAVSTKFLLFGNLLNYYLGIRKGTFSLDVDPYNGFANDTVRFRVTMRVAGNVANEKAFSVLKTAAS